MLLVNTFDHHGNVEVDNRDVLEGYGCSECQLIALFETSAKVIEGDSTLGCAADIVVDIEGRALDEVADKCIVSSVFDECIAYRYLSGIEFELADCSVLETESIVGHNPVVDCRVVDVDNVDALGCVL